MKRPGTQVRARKGYWALTAAETARATAPPKPGPPPAVAKSLAGISGGLRPALRPHLGRHRAGRGRQDACHLRVGGDSAAAGQRPPRRWAGSCSPRSTPRASRCSKGQVGEAARWRGAARRRDHDSTRRQASCTLRLSVEGRPDDVLDSEDRAVEVPDFTEPKARLTTPRVYVARNAREFQTIRSDPAAPPTATREFRRTERLLLRLDTRRRPAARRRDLHRAAAEPPGRQDGRPAGDRPAGAEGGDASTSRWPTCRPASSCSRSPPRPATART